MGDKQNFKENQHSCYLDGCRIVQHALNTFSLGALSCSQMNKSPQSQLCRDMDHGELSEELDCVHAYLEKETDRVLVVTASVIDHVESIARPFTLETQKCVTFNRASGNNIGLHKQWR